MSSNKKYSGESCVFFRGEKLGHGGNGTVYDVTLMEDGGRNIDYPLVAKFFTYDKVGKEKEKEKRYSRFKNEVQVLSEHKEIDGIIEIIDCYCPESVPDGIGEAWYLMPKAEEYKIYRRRSINQKLDDMLSLAYTLQKLHKKKLAHRDIKPENILTLNGKIVLSDFGLIWGASDERLTETNESIGPYKIMPPELEHIQPEMNLEFMPSDVYLFAKVLWMNLKNNNIGFRGCYNRGDDQIYLDKNEYRVCTLEPIHKLLEQATYEDMNKRITIDKCIEYLKLQKQIFDHSEEISEIMLKQLQFDEDCKRIAEKNTPDEYVYADKGVIDTMLKKLISNANVYVKDLNISNKKQIGVSNYSMSSDGIFHFSYYVNRTKMHEYIAKIKKMVCKKNGESVELELDNFQVEEPDYAPYGRTKDRLGMMPVKEYFSSNERIIITKPQNV